jgi:hypothetical protein
MILACAFVALMLVRRRSMSRRAAETIARARFIHHPVYGGALEPGFRPIPGFVGYSVNEHCQVIGARGKILRHNRDCKVKLYTHKNKPKMKPIYHLALLTFYPNVKPKAGVDHIDENYCNNYITNLQWSTPLDNTRKSKIGRAGTHGPAQSKPVWLLNGYKGDRVKRYNSLSSAILDVFRETSMMLNLGNVSQSARSGGCLSVKGRFFSYEEPPDLPGEEWRTSPTLDRVLNQVNTPDDKKVKVSSFGRIRNSKGVKGRGCIHKRKNNGMYRVTKVNGVQYEVHQLIFMGWYDKPAPKKTDRDENGNQRLICHDDAAPKDKNDRYRNWPIDLSIGTQSENARSSHEERRRQKRSREEEGTGAARTSCKIRRSVAAGDRTVAETD